MTYKDVFRFLDTLRMFGIKLGLNNVKKLLDALDNPQNNLKFIHVAGTNGKGSICSLLNSALVASSNKVGTFTSPHLINIRERFRINGIPVSKEIFVSAITNISNTINELSMADKDFHPTYFEVAVVAAILIFCREKVDFVVWETGMGGRFDATNVVKPIITVISNIALDHTKYLGSTIEKIAFEKAGIIKKNIPLFSACHKKDAIAVIQKQCKAKNSPFFQINKDFKAIKYTYKKYKNIKMSVQVTAFKKTAILDTNLWGFHQSENIATANAIISYMLNKKFIKKLSKPTTMFEKAKWHARLEFLPNGILLDGAHNKHAGKALSKSLLEVFPNKKWNILSGILEDKEPISFFETLMPICASLTLIKVNNIRSCKPERIFKQIQNKYPKLSLNIVESLDIAIKQFQEKENPLITGSLYLAGEVLEHFYPKNKDLSIL